MTPATRLLSLITEHFGAIETTAQDPLDAQILRDLHPDSLDLIEIMMEIEDQFQITLTDEEAMDMPEDATLRDLWEKIEAKLPPAVQWIEPPHIDLSQIQRAKDVLDALTGLPAPPAYVEESPKPVTYGDIAPALFAWHLRRAAALDAKDNPTTLPAPQE